MEASIAREFAVAVTGPASGVDLFGGAMAIARIGNPSADAHRTAASLDLIAETIHERLALAPSTEQLIDATNAVLFDEMGFQGNAAAYGDPANSYLDLVVERRLGIPITLSLVYLEVGARVGLACEGVGFPGHFLVRCGPLDDAIFLDPFNAGARRSADELIRMLQGAKLGGATPESFLAAVTPRQMLQRMLNNLHVIFRNERDIARWLAVVELQLVLEPWSASLVGERGMLRYRTGSPELALTDLERYVGASQPEAVQAGARRLLDELRTRFGLEGDRDHDS